MLIHMTLSGPHRHLCISGNRDGAVMEHVLQETSVRARTREREWGGRGWLTFVALIS